MPDIDCFTVSTFAGDRTVIASWIGASWGLTCSDDDCPARRVIGYKTPEHAGEGAVGHLRWHAAGCPMCEACGATLGAGRRGKRCARGTCAVQR